MPENLCAQAQHLKTERLSAMLILCTSLWGIFGKGREDGEKMSLETANQLSWTWQWDQGQRIPESGSCWAKPVCAKPAVLALRMEANEVSPLPMGKVWKPRPISCGWECEVVIVWHGCPDGGVRLMA